MQRQRGELVPVGEGPSPVWRSGESDSRRRAPSAALASPLPIRWAS